MLIDHRTVQPNSKVDMYVPNTKGQIKQVLSMHFMEALIGEVSVRIQLGLEEVALSSAELAQFVNDFYITLDDKGEEVVTGDSLSLTDIYEIISAYVDMYGSYGDPEIISGLEAILANIEI